MPTKSVPADEPRSAEKRIAADRNLIRSPSANRTSAEQMHTGSRPLLSARCFPAKAGSILDVAWMWALVVGWGASVPRPLHLVTASSPAGPLQETDVRGRHMQPSVTLIAAVPWCLGTCGRQTRALTRRLLPRALAPLVVVVFAAVICKRDGWRFGRLRSASRVHVQTLSSSVLSPPHLSSALYA